MIEENVTLSFDLKYLEIMVFETRNTDVITDMTISPIDYERKAAMPGIAGYVVKKGDTIWSIARKYYATTESIRKINMSRLP